MCNDPQCSCHHCTTVCSGSTGSSATSVSSSSVSSTTSSRSSTTNTSQSRPSIAFYPSTTIDDGNGDQRSVRTRTRTRTRKQRQDSSLIDQDVNTTVVIHDQNDQKAIRELFNEADMCENIVSPQESASEDVKRHQRFRTFVIRDDWLINSKITNFFAIIFLMFFCIFFLSHFNLLFSC